MRIMILIRDKNQIARGNLCIRHCLLSKHSKWAGRRFALSIRRIASHTRLIRRRGRQLVKRLGGRIFSRRAEKYSRQYQSDDCQTCNNRCNVQICIPCFFDPFRLHTFRRHSFPASIYVSTARAGKSKALLSAPPQRGNAV